MDAKRKEIALFRYRLIAPLVREARPIPGELTRRAREIAACKYDFPYSERHAVSVDTLLNWVNRYRNAGFDGLVPRLPRPRKDRGQYRVITAQIADQIERLKREDPHRTGARLLRELALSSGKDQPPVSAATLYRFLKQRGLTAQKLLTGASFQPRRNRSHINFIWDEEREVLTKWRRSKDKNLVSLRLDRAAGARGPLVTGGIRLARSADCRPQLRFPLFQTDVGFGGDLIGMGASVSPRWF